jgi:hypothetical protein
MLAGHEQLVAVQIPAVVIKQTEAMIAGHRHLPFGRRKKKHVPMFDDDGFGNAMGHY